MPPLPDKTRATAAFTMLELAIVITIIGVVMTMGAVSYEQIVETARRSATDNKMDAIEKALMDFRVKYNRLPCPADLRVGNGTAGYGTEFFDQASLNKATCGTISAHLRGAVPVKALDLPDEFMLDGWGRRFTLQTSANYTYPTFSGTPLDIANDDGGLIIRGSADPVRSLDAAYSLISHGPNGYGAYDTDGNQQPFSEAGANELVNISTSSTDSYQQEIEEGAAGTFDDIVRFKERWQMATAEDAYSFAGAKPQLVLGGTVSGNLWLIGLKQTASGLWTMQKNIWGGVMLTQPAGVTVSGTNINAMMFTPDNDHLFVYSNSTTTCRIMRISGSTFTDVPGTPVPVTSCPAYNSLNAVAMSDNGYLAMSDHSNNSVQLLKQSGDNFTAVSSFIPSLGGSFPNSLSFSKNGELLAISAGTTTGLQLYRRNASGLGYTVLPFSVSLSAAIASSALSPDGKYLAASTTSNPQKLYIWRITAHGAMLTQLTSPTSSPITTSSVTGAKLAFSADGRYLAVGADGSASKYPVVYRIDDGDVFTSVTTYAPLAANIVSSFAFDSNGQNMAMSFTTGSGFVTSVQHLRSSVQYYQAGGAINTEAAKAAAFIH